MKGPDDFAVRVVDAAAAIPHHGAAGWRANERAKWVDAFWRGMCV
jgi:hypothetical protein